MELRDKFTTQDEDDVEDKSAIFYMKEQDMMDFLSIIKIARSAPRFKFWSRFQRADDLERQLRNAMR